GPDARRAAAGRHRLPGLDRRRRGRARPGLPGGARADRDLGPARVLAILAPCLFSRAPPLRPLAGGNTGPSSPRRLQSPGPLLQTPSRRWPRRGGLFPRLAALGAQAPP